MQKEIKSKAYSAKLYKRFEKELKLLIKYPDLGIKTELETVRGLIVDDYIIYYENKGEKIIVHTLWDCRQNPEDFEVK